MGQLLLPVQCSSRVPFETARVQKKENKRKAFNMVFALFPNLFYFQILHLIKNLHKCFFPMNMIQFKKN